MNGKKITREELEQFLRKHKLWLEDEDGGERADLREADLRVADLREADLREADLRGANLRGADLSRADLREADLRGADLRVADLREADLRGANLRGADLSRADLRGADLREADLDYSCLPLWCGSLKANFDDRQLKQIAYHLVKAGLNSTNASAETKKELEKLVDFANGFHRVKECGKIEKVTISESKEEHDFVTHLVNRSGDHYGNIGDATNYKDAIGRPLFVGDVVGLYNSNLKQYSDSVIVKRRLCYRNNEMKAFVSGIEADCDDEKGTLDGWKIVKKRSFEDVENGAIYYGLKYVKEED